MNIIENRAAWFAAYQTGFLAHYEQTGQTDYKLYQRVKNLTAPAGPGIDPRRARLMLITSAGAYLCGEQDPFDAPHPLGDYTIRRIPTATSLYRLAYAHTHYDHTAVNADPQVLVPLRHLEDLVAEGRLGSLTPSTISFMGYQTDVTRIVDEVLPLLLEIVAEEQPTAALLVPA